MAEHLSGHLERLPQADKRTRAVIEAMRADESRHRQTAIDLGAAQMPAPVRLAMRLAAKVMTTEPYASARRVYWVVDNGSSHNGH